MSNSMYENALFLTNLKNKQQAEQAWGDLDYMIGERNRLIRKVNDMVALINERDEIISDLQQELALAKADAKGSTAALNAYSEAHPDSPLKKAVGTRKDGKPLTKARQIFNETFDRIARELGIKNPEKHRVG